MREIKPIPCVVIPDNSAERNRKAGFVLLPGYNADGYEPRSLTFITPDIVTKGGRERTSATYAGSRGSRSFMEAGTKRADIVTEWRTVVTSVHETTCPNA
jgi:hypothetical protein